MVYNLISVIARRNFSNLSVKTFRYTDVVVQRRIAARFQPLRYTTYSDQKQPSTSPEPGKDAIVSTVISKTLSGKIKGDDIKKLASIVVQESQFRRYSEAPSSVQMLSFAGLIPFAGIPLLIVINGSALPGLVFAELAYGATILSFLGGANWIHTITQGQATLNKLGWCVTPQLLGWFSLLLPAPLGILVTSLGLGASLTHDVLLTNYPQWFKSLRFVLTTGAVGSLLLTFVLNIIA